MGRPTTPATPQPAEPSSPKLNYHWAYSLPASVKDQFHWSGTDADLHYGLIEPTPAKLADISRDPNKQVRDVAVGFVAALGQLDADGNVVVDDEGVPVLRAVGYMEVERWLNRIGAKGMQLVVGEFQRLFTPTTDEGNALRASRRRR